MNASKQLAISVGGSKCAFAIVGGSPPAILARSGRIEWTGEGITNVEAFVVMLARESLKLLKQARIPAAGVERVGVAWPGPGNGGRFEATFIPGCQQPQPIPVLLRSALIAALGSGFATVPRVVLDAVARAAGEARPGGALYPSTANGMLVNVATGIASGLVRQGRALLAYPGIGENYGQSGRFLSFNTALGEWHWRPTADGTVPPHSPQEVRWTRHCAGPALARRMAYWCDAHRLDASKQNRAVTEALRHYKHEGAPRDTTHEMTLLHWATTEAGRHPEGPLGRFVEQVATEIGTALRTLLQVFASENIGTIVLAGGVGENFGRSEDLAHGTDDFLTNVQQAVGKNGPRVCRAKLGVDAEFLGLASDSFVATP